MISRSDPIESLGLITSVKNVLKGGGITTVGQLLEMTPLDFIQMGGLGVKSRNSIYEALETNGFWFANKAEAHRQWAQRGAAHLGRKAKVNEVASMTLRDYFAAAALQGLCAGFSALENDDWPRHDEPEGYEVTASHAYLLADAMLKARDGKN